MPDDQPSGYGGEGYGVEAEPEPVLASAPVSQRRVEADEQLGRNEPCQCGSGKKLKKCHGA